MYRRKEVIIMNNFDVEILKAILEENGRDNPEEKCNDKDDKVYMKGDTVTYVNPAFKASIGKNSKSDKKAKVRDNIKKEYEETLKVAANDFVYVPVVLEHSFDIHSDDYNFGATTYLLGAFIYPKDALAAVEDSINKDTVGWKPIKDSIHIPNDEDNGCWRVYQSKYFFSRDLMSLYVKHRIILKVELNNFNVISDISSYKMMDHDTYKALIDVFGKFRKGYDALLSNIEKGIHNLLEE